ncbi:MAG: hypothetical protein NTW87_34935 [Planctomycetota bacterium]|nr:hypothetical protein [Planctomycetota bacterium]
MQAAPWMRLGLCVSLLLATVRVCAESTVSLIAPDKPQGGWSFGNGPEFPGATGTLSVETDADKPVLVLHGDFTKGGNYVQAGRDLPGVAFDKLSFRLKAAGANRVTMRIVDASKQCHQIDLRLDGGDAWQAMEFPIAEFFKAMGTSAALPNISRYENCGGRFRLAARISTTKTNASKISPAIALMPKPTKGCSPGPTGSGVPMMNFPAGISTRSRFTPLPRSSVFVGGRFVRFAYCSMDSWPSQRGNVGAGVSAANVLAARQARASSGNRGGMVTGGAPCGG